MLNLCGIVVDILKMATGRNFSMSGINSGHHNLPTYEMALKSDNAECVRYCGGHFYYYYYSSSLSLSLSLSPFFPRTMNLSTANLRNYWTEFHETL
jgi:hypothetical protein